LVADAGRLGFQFRQPPWAEAQHATPHQGEVLERAGDQPGVVQLDPAVHGQGANVEALRGNLFAHICVGDASRVQQPLSDRRGHPLRQVRPPLDECAPRACVKVDQSHSLMTAMVTVAS
jgi:hypothetical protein